MTACLPSLLSGHPLPMELYTTTPSTHNIDNGSFVHELSLLHIIFNSLSQSLANSICKDSEFTNPNLANGNAVLSIGVDVGLENKWMWNVPLPIHCKGRWVGDVVLCIYGGIQQQSQSLDFQGLAVKSLLGVLMVSFFLFTCVCFI